MIPRILYAEKYVSPRTRTLTLHEQQVRSRAYDLKQAVNKLAVEEAVTAMLKVLPFNERAWLVPVPSRNREIRANWTICQELASRVNWLWPVKLIERTRPVESTCERHRRGLGGLPIEQHFIRRRPNSWITAQPVYFVDNVATSGNTLTACHQACGFGEGLVYASCI